MTDFPQRFADLEALLLARRSVDGGWPHWLKLEQAATSIVATAHALEMLRQRGYGIGHPAIDDGLRYLAGSVQQHARARRLDPSSSARGQWARYPAYALWGLTRFPTAAHQKELAPGIRFCLAWLHRHRRDNGGWTVDNSTTGPLSLPATMVAVHALDRLVLHGPDNYRGPASQLSAAARAAVTREAEGKASHRWWRQIPNGMPCAGATSLAVLTLADGAPEHRRAARQGVRHLLADPTRWVQAAPSDDQVQDRNWRILSFSLGLRAVLHTPTRVDPADPLLRPAVEHLDAIWNEQQGAWATHPGGDASTTGSFAVITAVAALKQAFPFDPIAHLHGLRGKRPRRREASRQPQGRRTMLVEEESRSVSVFDERGVLLAQCTILGRRRWAILLEIARRHHRASRRQPVDQATMTVSARELGLRNDVREDSVARTIRRLNDDFVAAAMELGNLSFKHLFEQMTVAGSTEHRYGMEEVVVQFRDRPPRAVADRR